MTESSSDWYHCTKNHYLFFPNRYKDNSVHPNRMENRRLQWNVVELNIKSKSHNFCLCNRYRRFQNNEDWNRSPFLLRAVIYSVLYSESDNAYLLLFRISLKHNHLIFWTIQDLRLIII